MKGYLQIYTGNGKGKSTAAFGLALRAAGAGMSVYIAQFVKGRNYSEITAVSQQLPQITLRQFGRGCFIVEKPTGGDVAAAREGLAVVSEVLTSGEYDLVILITDRALKHGKELNTNKQEKINMGQTMEQLREEMEQCRKCDLWRSRNHLIFGEGNHHAPIFIIGEAPGRDEDRVGRPFIGPSGILLDNIFAACGFNRENHLFISNIVRCRPPGNRPPTPQEAAACLPWLN